MSDVSKENQEVFDAIIQYKREHDGCPPTIRHLAKMCGRGSTTVYHHLAALEKAGMITRQPGDKHIEVAGGRWEWECEGEDEDPGPRSPVGLAKVRAHAEGWVHVRLFMYPQGKDVTSEYSDMYTLGTLVPHKDDWPALAEALKAAGWEIADEADQEDRDHDG